MGTVPRIAPVAPTMVTLAADDQADSTKNAGLPGPVATCRAGAGSGTVWMGLVVLPLSSSSAPECRVARARASTPAGDTATERAVLLTGRPWRQRAGAGVEPEQAGVQPPGQRPHGPVRLRPGQAEQALRRPQDALRPRLGRPGALRAGGRVARPAAGHHQGDRQHGDGGRAAEPPGGCGAEPRGGGCGAEPPGGCGGIAARPGRGDAAGPGGDQLREDRSSPHRRTRHVERVDRAARRPSPGSGAPAAVSPAAARKPAGAWTDTVLLAALLAAPW